MDYDEKYEFFEAIKFLNREDLSAIGKLKYDILQGYYDKSIYVNSKNEIYLWGGFEWEKLKEDYKLPILEVWKERLKELKK